MSSSHSGTTSQSNSSLPRLPFGGKRILINGVAVKFGASVHSHVFDCGALVVRPGDQLVLQTDKGLQLGKAVSLPERQIVNRDDVSRIVRRANETDLRDYEDCQRLQERGMRVCIKWIRKLRLKMKLIQVEYLLDRSKAIFYFTSEKRVDFRRLVRELANELKIRIEMRQIGVRDGAGVIGGIGPCGRQLCCSSFLTSFRSVSVRHAKAQGLSLNPQKVTGMCGRLKCCLTYEEPVYKEMKKYAPKRSKSVLTAKGPATIRSVEPVSRRVNVEFVGGSREQLHIRDVVVLDHKMSREEMKKAQSHEDAVMARRRNRSGGGRASIDEEEVGQEYLWADADHDLSYFSAFGNGKKHGSRSKKKS
jgi:cell fate regulator YaaT (PSP1 superfamily)